MESNVTHSPTCRLCSADFKHGVLIFSEEGKRLYLQAKIRKYLYITVSMDDRLSKCVCNNCCRKIEAIHRFATMAVKNQERLNTLLTENHASVVDQKRQEHKGLLHTYLTKGILEKQVEDTEEMEVKVDPMLFLQCNSEEDQSEDDEENLADVILDSDHGTKSKQQEPKTEVKYSNKLYECSMCVRRFHSEFALQNHAWSHISKNKRIILNTFNNYCLRPEEKREESDKEEGVAESESKAAENNNCDGETGENGNGVKFTCPICGKVISTKGNLKVHLETHRPKGKYGCDICGRIFKTQSNLHRHKEYHTGIQFTCNVCGRVYPTNSTLRAHSITHSDLRPHKCPLCDKTFKRNQDLKFHINQHTGARPYKCPYCPKAFASSGNCFSHRKRMHPLEVERDRDLAAKIMR